VKHRFFEQSPTDAVMSEAAVEFQRDTMPEDPQAWREKFRRRMAEQGVLVRLPHPEATWQPPEHPLPVSADEASRFVVELRRTGRL
jgi:hypothetical protein